MHRGRNYAEVKRLRVWQDEEGIAYDICWGKIGKRNVPASLRCMSGNHNESCFRLSNLTEKGWEIGIFPRRFGFALKATLPDCLNTLGYLGQISEFVWLYIN